MSYAPVYHFPNPDSKVKILVNGKPIIDVPSKQTRYINFVGDIIPTIIVNDESDTYDINLEEFVNKVISKKKPKNVKNNVKKDTSN